MKATSKSAHVSNLGLVLCLLIMLASNSFAGSATWKSSPASGDWNTATNWTPQTVPNGPFDVATFATSNTTAVSVSAQTEVNGITFNPRASAFTITVDTKFHLIISGPGITNNSGIMQNFVTAVDAEGLFGSIIFTNSATAGTLTTFTNKKPAVSGYSGGFLQFLGSSNAGDATYVNESGGETAFHDAASAGNGMFFNAGGAANVDKAAVVLFATTNSSTLTPTAANGTFVNDGGTAAGAPGGETHFSGSTPTAGNATLIANGGTNGGEGGLIRFDGRSTGGTARVELFGNGKLDISPHGTSGVKVGSIEGDGTIILGSRHLTVGLNNLSTTFAGLIEDGPGFSGGALTKTGDDVLVLTGANTYTGGTTLKGSPSNKGNATLEVDNTTGSGTGSGPVVVKGGALRGTGTIAGPVTIAGVHNGPSEDTFLAPGKFGKTAPATLTIQNTLTLGPIATYEVSMTATTATKVVANGVTIDTSSADIRFTHLFHGTLPPGTVFTIIDNTSASSIVGTFLNLHDGWTFTQFGNTYKANYQGGDGNDLTLTVQ
jgi:autotransporter-associated beta strand protein